MPRSGESLGKYKLIRRIGLGGMAEVWLARSTGPAGFAKNLVVKTVLEHQAQNTEFIAQFLDEARLAALLTHPNIVQIFDLGDSDGIYFIAMEYIRGQDLQDVRKQCSDASKPLPLALLSRIACGVCEGLHYAHELKSDDGKRLELVHRDISPENVLISYDGVVKIVDFGIAKASISQVTTRAGLFKGKLHYATPERLLGQPIDRRDDIYGVGAVLYETATGQPPISGRSEGEMVKKILDGEFDKPSVLVPDMDPEFERIVLKSMSWAPEERYPTARALQVDLERFIAASGVPAANFDLAEFMKDLFEDEVGTSSGNFSSVDFDYDELTPTTDPLEHLDDGTKQAIRQEATGHVAGGRPRDAIPSGSHEIGPDGLDLELESGAVEEEVLDGPTIETPGLAAPDTIVAPPPAAAISAEAPAPVYEDDEPPIPPRNRMGLLAGIVVALVVLSGIVGLVLWGPWSSEGGTPTGPSDPGGGPPGTMDGAVAQRGDGGAALPPPVEDASPIRRDAAPLFRIVDAAPAEASVAAEPDASEAPAEDGGTMTFSDAAAPDVAESPPPRGPTGTLALRGPPGCSATLGSARLGGLPLERDVPVGSQEVRVRCPHGIRRTLNVTISEGQTVTETIRIRTGTLLLLVRPWAEVFVDGRRRGITPLGAIDLPEGNHTIRLVNSEIGARQTKRVRIRAGERTTLRVRLDR